MMSVYKVHKVCEVSRLADGYLNSWWADVYHMSTVATLYFYIHVTETPITNSVPLHSKD